MNPTYQPWSPGVPLCSWAECAAYDGKCCRLTGFRPESVCEPAVAQVAAQLAAEVKRREEAEAALLILGRTVAELRKPEEPNL